MALRSIGIIVAMSEETKYLLRRIPSATKETFGAFPVYRFTQGIREFCIIESGIGPVRSLAAVRSLTEAMSPELIISLGFGGGLSDGLSAGDVVIGTRFFTCRDKGLVEETGIRTASPLPRFAAGTAKETGTFTIREGAIISTTGIHSKREIAGLMPAEVSCGVVDMETCPVARYATLARIPLLAIRCISDGLDEELGFTIDEFTDRSMQISTVKVLLTVVRRPWIIPQLFRLSRTTRRAGESLSGVFDRLRASLS